MGWDQGSRRQLSTKQSNYLTWGALNRVSWAPHFTWTIYYTIIIFAWWLCIFCTCAENRGRDQGRPGKYTGRKCVDVKITDKYLFTYLTYLWVTCVYEYEHVVCVCVCMWAKVRVPWCVCVCAHLIVEVVSHILLLLRAKLQQSGDGTHQLRWLFFFATDEFEHHILEISGPS